MRVVIADDSALLREGLARLLAESGVDVCETVADGTGLVAAVDRHLPDVAIVDIRMPPTYTHEGAVAAIELRDRMPALGVLLLSQAVETHFASQLLERHARAVRLPAQGPGGRRRDADGRTAHDFSRRDGPGPGDRAASDACGLGQ